MIRFPAGRMMGLMLALFSLALSAVRGAEAVVVQRHGDDPRWAAPDWDDHNWEKGNSVPTRAGIYWVRFRFKLQAGERPHALGDLETSTARDLSVAEAEGVINSVFMAAPYSYELYWDGRLLGRSGVVGSRREAEETGLLDNVFALPIEMRSEGEHVAAIRLSSFHYNFPATRIGIGIFMSNQARHFALEGRRPMVPMMAVGGALLVALISAMLYALVERWRALLLCSIVSFALGVFHFLIAWRWIHNDRYEWFCPRLVAITWVMTLIAALFPWMLLEQFGAPRRRWWLAALLPLLVGAWAMAPLYELKALWLCRAMLTVSLGITGWAAWRRRAGARFVFVGVLLGLVLVRADRREFLDPSFLVMFGALVLFVFATLALQLRRDRRRAEEMALTAARLEIELLKKNIQPHFLMNTLTTIMEVIEEDPKSAVTLIEALAGEFRILAQVAGKKLISLGEELELCRAHIRIMSLRRGVDCSLETVGVDENSPVPPALLHTLVEGGLTHQAPRAGRLKFTLEGFYQPGLARYTLVAHGETPRATAPIKEGTGLRYVKARLEESFAGRWTLTAGPVAEGWQTVIEIKVLPGEESLP